MAYLDRFALLIGAAALFAGCGGSQTSMLSVTPASDTSLAKVPYPLMKDPVIRQHWRSGLHADGQKSWIAPDEKRERALLFAADAELDQIDIYSLPGMQLKGQLTGSNINYPQGLCSDTAGNVYVTEEGNFLYKGDNPEIDKYSRTGLLLARIPDTYGFPVGCAVDPATGALAVTNWITTLYVPGNVLVFSETTSQPRVLTNPYQYGYLFAGYGPHSNLWVTGYNAHFDNMLSRCGASGCTTVNVSGGTLNYSAGIGWDSPRRTWVIFENCYNTNYGPTGACSMPVSKKGRLGALTTYETYKGEAVCGFFQGALAESGKYVVGSSFAYCSADRSSSFYRWAYDGGMALNYAILSSKYSQPSGVAISIKGTSRN